MHRVKWKHMASPRKMGGLGVSDVGIHNRALLAKWLWMLQDESEAH